MKTTGEWEAHDHDRFEDIKSKSEPLLQIFNLETSDIIQNSS